MFKLFLIAAIISSNGIQPVGQVMLPMDFHDEESCHAYAAQDFDIKAREGFGFDYRCVQVSIPS